MRSEEAFDYVIVGSGAAGSVLAARLSEDGAHSVCLIEAGPPDSHPFIHIPAGFTKILPMARYVWHFGTVPTERTGGRSVFLPQGRTLGGSTSVNGMIFVRGQPSDFDGWAQMGNHGWSFADVLPYFQMLEDREAATDATETSSRGRGGPMPVRDVVYPDPLSAAIVASGQMLGLPLNADYNGADQYGIGPYQTTIRKGYRASTATAYLKPARSRQNLTVRTGMLVGRILFEGKAATGVQAIDIRAGRSALTIRARKEVIISAGTINTTRLLELSGIGDPAVLKDLGVPVVHALPGVGRNLQDHYYVSVIARVQGADTFNEKSRGWKLLREILLWSLGRPSLLGLPPSLVQFFTKSRPELDHPDMQGIFFPASYGPQGLARDPALTCGMWQHRPHSRGYVRTLSPDFAVNPEVQPNYLADQIDRQTVLAGLKFARALIETPEIRPFIAAELAPGKDVRTDDELLDYCYRSGTTAFHPVGTAKMGPASDPMAVVDNRLRIHGLGNIRVADASVMPTLVSGNTMATTIMIGEKASRMILNQPELESPFR